MATSNGPWQNRARIEWVYTVPNPVAGASTVTVTAQAYLRMDQYASQFHTGTKSWSGAWGSGSASQYYGLNPNERVLIVSGSKVVSLTGSNQSVSFSATAYQYHGTTGSTLGVTVKPRVYLAPTAAPAPTVTRNSDTSQTVTWDRKATSGAPVTSQQILRSEYNGSVWSSAVAVSTVNTTYSSNATQSITDTSTVAGKQYRYSVKAINSAGNRTSPVSVNVFTTPTAPVSVIATKIDNDNIKIEVIPSVLYSAQTVIERQLGGTGSWVVVATLANGVVEYDWPAESSSTVQFRASTQVNSSGSVGHALIGPATLSNVVGLTAPPNPPTNLSPNGLAVDIAESLTATWKHNTVDSSPQSAYQLRYKAASAGSWTELAKTISGVSSHVFPADFFPASDTYQWEVQTWGAHAESSGYSATAIIEASQIPSVNIVSPEPIVESSKVQLIWGFFDPDSTAQSQWQATLSGDFGAESRSGNGSTTQVTFNTILDNESEYEVAVRARDGAGLWSEWVYQPFTTDFIKPDVPQIEARWDDNNGWALIDVATLGGPPEFALTDSLDLERSDDEGFTWVFVGSFTVDNTTLFDKEAPLGNTSTQYRVRAWSTLPSSSLSDVATLDTTTAIGHWAAGSIWENSLRIEVNQGAAPKMDVTTALYERSLHWFAGRTYPVETSGDSVNNQGSVEFTVKSVEDKESARRMALLPAPHLIRLPDGDTKYVSIGPVQEQRLAPGWYRLSFSVTEVGK